MSLLFNDPFFIQPRERLLSAHWTDDFFDDPFFSRPLMLTPFLRPIDYSQASTAAAGANNAVESSAAASSAAGEKQDVQQQQQQQQQIQTQQQQQQQQQLATTSRPFGFRVELAEDKDNFLVHAELPGFKKDDIKVRLDNNSILTIEAERKDERKGEDETHRRHWSERSYGKFVRTFRLPASTVDADKVNATLENGILNVKVGKIPRAEKDTRHITIQ